MSSQNGSASLVPELGPDATACPMADLEAEREREAIKSSCSDLTNGLATESDLEGFGLSFIASMKDKFFDLVFLLLEPAPNPFEAAIAPQGFGLG